MFRNTTFFGGTGTMKIKRARRPQNMFLFDPEFRYRPVDEYIPNDNTNPGMNDPNLLVNHQGIQKLSFMN